MIPQLVSEITQIEPSAKSWPKSAKSTRLGQHPKRSKPRFPFGRLLRIHGFSMAPVLNPGELVVVGEGEFEERPPARGEIVAARPVACGGRALVKRITGLPHDRIELEDRTWQLGEDQFFLLSDQAGFAMDSRVFGPVSRDELIGPVRCRLWPWKSFHV